MGHEALKFNVFTKNKENWQPIVGDVYHGTFFMVYIKFKNVEQRGDFYIYTVDFKLQNYNGSITMGLDGKPTIERRIYENDMADLREEIERINKVRHIKGESPMSEKEIAIFLEENKLDFNIKIPVQPFNIKFEHMDQLDPDTGNHINKSIELDPINIPLEGKVLNTICELNNPPINLYNIANVENSKYVNPNHYKRAGEEFLEVGYRDKSSMGDFINNMQGGMRPLSKCNPSRSFLI